MKLNGIFFSILTVLSISASSACASESLISENAIGPVYLGLEKSEIKELGFQITTKMEEYEGFDYEVYVIEIQPGVEITAVFDSADRIAKLTTPSSFFVTTKGARVGTSLDNLREIYPNGELYKGSSDAGLQFNFTGGFPHHVFVFDAIEIGSDCILNEKGCPENLGSKESIRFYMYSASE